MPRNCTFLVPPRPVGGVGDVGLAASQRRAPGGTGRGRAGRLAGIGTALALAIAAIAAPSRGIAAAIEGVTFPEKVEVEGRRLDLHGLALLRYGFVIRAYVAGLYLEDPKHAARVLEDLPKRLDLSYFWGLEGKQFADAAKTMLERNLPEDQLEALMPRIDRMGSSFRAVEAGDRYSLTYLPGRGTELALNGTPLVTIEGADFAEAYFGIWLGEQPIDADMRDELLEGR